MALRILIVDDSPVTRAMLAEMVGALGHEVAAEAEGSEDGLAAFEEKKPDLVFLDLSIVGDNGLVVLEEMRRRRADAKVVVVSGNAQQAIVDKVKALGALAYVSKPFEISEIEAALSKAASG